LEAFRTRLSWYHNLPNFGEPQEMLWANDTILWMVQNFQSMGMILQMPGPHDVPGVPDRLFTEVRDEHTRDALFKKLSEAMKAEDFDSELHRRTGFHNKEQLRAFKAIRFGRKPD